MGFRLLAALVEAPSFVFISRTLPWRQVLSILTLRGHCFSPLNLNVIFRFSEQLLRLSIALDVSASLFVFVCAAKSSQFQ